MFQTKAILDHEVWQSHHDLVPPAKEEEVALHYERAKLMCQHSGLSLHDIEALTEKFWDFHFDSKIPSTCTPQTKQHQRQCPPTPYCGIPRVAIVFARLIVHGKSQGVKPFVVFLSDAGAMRPGVSLRILLSRPGTKPLDHAITTFHHVQLPPSALLGSTSKPKHERAEFLRQIWRVAVGTLSLSIMGISAMRVGTRIAALYSERRTILSPDGH
ncbi:hypothetical protein FPOA_12655 [Fusarium poae]|uniref:Uncharacterized protein n=1 Tax=Fusarium poae TaxID=36050 RepID=A0A1B8A899_FUSPO|nr:hypothetical protein FPOA_12655 [Fusarium poae]